MGENCFEALITITSRLHSSPHLPSDHLQRNVIMCTYLHYLLSTPPNHTTEPSLPQPSNTNGKQQQQQADSSEANGINGGGGDSNNGKSLNYYATMTRGERNRPSMTTATFNMSSSNPDLTCMIGQDSNVSSPLDSVLQLGESLRDYFRFYFLNRKVFMLLINFRATTAAQLAK